MQKRHRAFHELDAKFGHYAEMWRSVLDVPDPRLIYHTARCTGPVCVVEFYGAAPEDLLRRLRRAFERLADRFADIAWHPDPTPR